MSLELLDDFQESNNPDGYQACYNCGQTNYDKITFSFWGGMLGPKMFNHVKCNSCGSTYNGKTGQSNKQAITIYVAITLIVGLIIGFFIIQL
ncbi:MAG: hypothetical protein GY810_19605 [Aureispira sp.]|nr:hypothetical protein [Aureispira sp.]